METPRIYLVRHGETAHNAARILQPPATPLSERGIAQAERVAARLAGVGLRRILVSDLRRAEMTAEAIARASGAPLLRDPDLAERNFGALRGRAYAELGFDPFAAGYEPPEGESWDAFWARADRAWLRAEAEARNAGGPIAVVTHGLVCRAFVSRGATLAPGLSLEACRWRNTSLSVLEAGEAWIVRVLDDCSHLDDTDDAEREGGAA